MSEDDWLDEKALTTSVAQRAVDKIYNSLEAKARRLWATYRNSVANAFEEYLLQKARHVSQVRNLIYDTDSARLSDIYVQCHLSRLAGTHHSEQISDSDLLNLIITERKSKKQRPTFTGAVRGPAGAGKSMLMRYLFLQIQRTACPKLPLFVELRDLGRKKATTLASIIADDLRSFGMQLLDEQIEVGLQQGTFILLLDGFDELRKIVQTHYQEQILLFCNSYPKCPVVVSGRPTDRMLSWNQFAIYDILPLTVDESIEVVQRLRFDERVKERFIEQINNRLKLSHATFLSSPLLTTIMLLTYSDVGRISGRRYEFFEDAFSALWSKHDARKGFERRRSTDLDKTQFIRLLSGFSLSTYSKELLQLSEREVMDNINVAKRITGIDVKPQDFMDDLIESVCLLVRDGPVFKFVHRTFEEYFTALYVSSLSSDKLNKIVDLLSSRIDDDNVLHLLFSMARRNVERSWVYPNLKPIYDRLRGSEELRRAYISFDLPQSSFLGVLRELYEVTPTTSDVLAALHAGEALGLRAYAPKALNILETDLSNINKIYEEVDGKQQREDTALLNVIEHFETL